MNKADSTSFLLSFSSDTPSPTGSEIDVFDELRVVPDDQTDVAEEPADLDLPIPLNWSEDSTISLSQRKRCRDEPLSTSSDVPLFSSDGAVDSIENYELRHRKRQCRGTWWGDGAHKPADSIDARISHKPERKKRDFKRTVDSGVWMNSDDTEPIADTQDDANTVHSFRLLDLPDHIFRKSQPKDLSGLVVAQERASLNVQRCVEEKINVVDLSGLALQELHGTTLRPLQYLTVEISGLLPPNQEAYRPILPSLHLLLSNNSLTNLPREIYSLSHLTTLSLRQNNLSEIPSSISRLINLKELNISDNWLRWLPWEILELTRDKLQVLRVKYNEFIQPVSRVTGISRPTSPAWQYSQLVAATKIAYLDITGSPVRGSPPTVTSTLEHCPSIAEGIWEQVGMIQPDCGNRVPSLLESALRECTKLSMLEQLLSVLPEDSASLVSRLLRDAWTVKEDGGKTCSVCDRNYIVPRTEWVEWWTENCELVPFLRRGCSWKCVINLDTINIEWRDCGWRLPSETEASSQY